MTVDCSKGSELMKKHINRLLVSIYCVFRVCMLYADGYISSEQYIDKPDAITPAVAEFQKFGSFEMNYSTGVPQINIPIYTIKEGNVSLPISLMYHASGVKVQDIPTSVGLGWMLSASGCISVERRGIEDSDNPRKLRATTKEDVNNFTNIGLECLALRDYDSETDVYHYNFLGHSGSFRQSLPDRIIRTAPYEPLEIRFIRPGTETIGGVIQAGFVIKDEEGNTFYFDKYASAYDGNEEKIHRSSWYLTKIKPSQSQDSITFEYMSTQSSYYSLYSEQTSIEGDHYEVISNPYSFFSTLNTTTDFLVEKIHWRNNTIEFNYQSRDYSRIGNNCWYQLNSISVLNMDEDTVCSAAFDYETVERTGSNNSKRLMLNAVTINGLSYRFEYNQTRLPDYIQQHPNPCYEDFWGYYNGNQSQHSHGLWYPREFADKWFYTDSISLPSRTPVEEYCKAASLSKIIFPTGGYTIFELESNYIAPQKIWGGLRLKQLSSYQKDGTLAFQKTYTYENAVTSDVILNSLTNQLKKELYFKDIPRNLCHNFDMGASGSFSGIYNLVEFSGTPYASITDGGAPLHYLKVTEYDGTIDDYSRKTVYEYSRQYIDTEDILEHFHDDDKLYIWNPDYLCHQGSPNFPLIRKAIYTCDSTEPIYEEQNIYTIGIYGKYNTGITLKQVVKQTGRVQIMIPQDFFCKYLVLDSYILSTYNLLTQKTITQDAVTQNIKYEYDSHYRTLSPIQIDKTQSDSSILRTKYTYPFMVDSLSAMVNSHFNVPIEETNYLIKDGITTKIGSTKTDYATVGNSWKAIKVTEKLNDTVKETTEYYYNEEGRLKSVKRNNMQYQNYVYGYDGTLPIAIIECDSLIMVNDLLTSNKLSILSKIGTIRNNAAFSDKLISTFVHKPLVGVISKTTPDGVTTNYEYDTFGRLKNIINHANQTVSSYLYHYCQ